MGLQPVRIFIGVDDADGTFIPLNVDASGNLGVNVEGELAVGELQLSATDPGLLALGATPVVAGSAYIGQAGRYRDPMPTLTSTHLLGTGGAASTYTYTQTGVDRFTTSPVPWAVRGWIVVDQTGTLYLDESMDNSTWGSPIQTTVCTVTTPGTPQVFGVSPFPLSKRYYRYRFVNQGGATPTYDQATFILKQGLQTTEDRITTYLFNAYTTDSASTGTDMDVTGFRELAVQVMTAAGTTSFTLDFEASVDGTNFVPNVAMKNIVDNTMYTALSGTASFNQAYRRDCSGLSKFRCNLSAYAHGTGSITVYARAIP